MPNVQEMSEDLKKEIARKPFAALVATLENIMIKQKTAAIELNFESDDFIVALRIIRNKTKDSN